MWIKIIPNDTLFFRTGKPFSMGSDTWTDIVFPPFPSTLYGAIRTYLIFQRDGLSKFKQKGYDDIGSTNSKGTMKIFGPFLYNQITNSVLFSIPCDLVKYKTDHKNKYSNSNSNSNQLTSIFCSPLPSTLFSDETFEKFEQIFINKTNKQIEQTSGYLDEITMAEYLTASAKSTSFYYFEKESKNLYVKELKAGIARNYITHNTKTGHLYFIPMIRLNKNICLLAKIDGVNNFPKNGIFQLGGEGKSVYYECVENDPLESIKNIEIFSYKNNIFKLYLATPAIFNKGWLPKWIDEKTLEGEKEGIKIKLVACSVGKYIKIGGWSMAENRPKPMYKAVPAGSVYYLKLLQEEEPQKIKDTFHMKPISDIYPEEGYGLAFIGNVCINIDTQ